MQNDWLSMQMSRDVIMHQGCRLAFGVCGQGVPVLLIQGVGVHGDGWLPQLEALAARHRCLTFDNRGMSRSQPANEQLSIEQMADDALALMKRLEPQIDATINEINVKIPQEARRAGIPPGWLRGL